MRYICDRKLEVSGGQGDGRRALQHATSYTCTGLSATTDVKERNSHWRYSGFLISEEEPHWANGDSSGQRHNKHQRKPLNITAYLTESERTRALTFELAHLFPCRFFCSFLPPPHSPPGIRRGRAPGPTRDLFAPQLRQPSFLFTIRRHAQNRAEARSWFFVFFYFRIFMGKNLKC